MTRADGWRSFGWDRWKRHAVPACVWLACLCGVIWLFGKRSQRLELMGVAQGEQRQIAALSGGRLMMVSVQRFENVSREQTVAVLADDRVRAELATAGAEAARLRAEIAAVRSRLLIEAAVQEADYVAESRRFAFDVEQKRIQSLELRVVIETDRITFERRRFELDRLKKLQAHSAANEYELATAETRYEALAKQIAENEKLLAQLEADIGQSEQRLKAFARQRPALLEIDKVLEPLKCAVTVQESRIAELSLERSTLVLRSPMDGVVVDVIRGAGEAVMPGEPILTIAASQPSEVIAYATAEQAARVGPGMATQVQLVRERGPRRTARSRVIEVGPTIVELPQRLWKNPTMPEWGWPIKVAVSPELKPLSGESVGVRVR
ncbi:MAG: HlyD family efflux transporter periplasmic adaptor subunit [Phycisphaerae bacterium]|nr:HlyD family efflux transporter periplasmic adaptor subunit [Phycisphaerae bacterium]